MFIKIGSEARDNLERFDLDLLNCLIERIDIQNPSIGHKVLLIKLDLRQVEVKIKSPVS